MSHKMLIMTENPGITRLGNNIDLELADITGGSRQSGARRRIALLLEDEPLISMDVETTLTEAGFEVHCAMSCAEAHQWLEVHRPDVVIVDIVLRDGRCTEVVTQLLRAGIPFIVHSGAYREGHIGTPFECGVWMTKPSEPSALVQAVNSAAAVQPQLAGITNFAEAHSS